MFSFLCERRREIRDLQVKTWLIVGGIAAGAVTTWLIVKPAVCDGGAL